MLNSIIPYPVRSYLFFSSKKCCIYAACDVLQTPIYNKEEGSENNANQNNKPNRCKDIKAKKRVCAYARVSTDSDSQAQSLENQTETYERLIKSNPEYEFAGIYHDKAITVDYSQKSGQ